MKSRVSVLAALFFIEIVGSAPPAAANDVPPFFKVKFSHQNCGSRAATLVTDDGEGFTTTFNGLVASRENGVTKPVQCTIEAAYVFTAGWTFRLPTVSYFGNARMFGGAQGRAILTRRYALPANGGSAPDVRKLFEPGYDDGFGPFSKEGGPFVPCGTTSARVKMVLSGIPEGPLTSESVIIFDNVQGEINWKRCAR